MSANDPYGNLIPDGAAVVTVPFIPAGIVTEKLSMPKLAVTAPLSLALNKPGLPDDAVVRLVMVLETVQPVKWLCWPAVPAGISFSVSVKASFWLPLGETEPSETGEAATVRNGRCLRQ